MQPKPRAAWIAVSICLSAALLAGVGAVGVFAFIDAGGVLDAEGTPTSPPATVTPEPPRPAAPPVLAPVGKQAGKPTRTGLATALEEALSAAALGPHVGIAVRDAGDGTLLYESDGRSSYIPASTTKVITAAAALEALGPRHTFSTTVVEGAGPDEIVLVGGGDPLLMTAAARAESKQGGGGEAAFAEAATIEELAARTAEHLRTGRDAGEGGAVRVRFDDTLFAETASPTWKASYIGEGHVAPVSALSVDQARLDWPHGLPRAADPAAAAAVAFVAALKEEGVRVDGDPERGRVGEPAAVIAAVESLTVAEITEHLLLTSDNDASEVLARQVAVAEGEPATFEGMTTAIRAVLGRVGIDAGQIELSDGSGLSRSNRLTPAVLTQVLAAATDPEHPRLGPLLTGLPVAAFNGSLDERFHAETVAAGAGVVRAKTGTLSGVSSLAGVVTTRDSGVLAFTVLADERNGWAEPDLDKIAAVLASCGCR